MQKCYVLKQQSKYLPNYPFTCVVHKIQLLAKSKLEIALLAS